jgi:hypothetical protein
MYKCLISNYAIYMKGSEKVPGMAVLHCNCRTYGNAYLITFTGGPLSRHTLAPSILPLLESSAVRPSHSILCVRRLRNVGNSDIRRVRWLGDVWLGAETTVPACHLSRLFQ